MSPPVRKVTLTIHVAASVGWVGALAVFLAHAVVSWTADDVQIVRAAALAMATSAWFVILPMALVSLASGVVQAMGTPWGLIRHYWIVFKLLLTVVATFVLLLKLAPISELANAAAASASSPADLPGLRTSLVVHAFGGLIILLAATTLGVVKPAGLTRWGRAAQSAPPAAARSGPGLPLWVKVSAAAVGGLLLLIALMILGGNHGPAAHMP